MRSSYINILNCALHYYYYPGFSRAAFITMNEFLPGTHAFTTPGSRETSVDKMPCLRAYAPSGIQTHDPLITSREHEPLHHSAPGAPTLVAVVPSSKALEPLPSVQVSKKLFNVCPCGGSNQTISNLDVCVDDVQIDQ